MPVDMDRFLNRGELPALIYASGHPNGKPSTDKDMPPDMMTPGTALWQQMHAARHDEYDHPYNSGGGSYVPVPPGSSASGFGVLKPNIEGIYPGYDGGPAVDDQWLTGIYYNVKNGSGVPSHYGASNAAMADTLDPTVMVSSFALPQPGSTPWRMYEVAGSTSTESGGGGGSGGGGKRKRRRIITVDQRRAANVRERRRMSHLNEAFDGLRKRVPTFAYEKKLSRIETLRLAVTYIKFMDDLLGRFGDKRILDGTTDEGGLPGDAGDSVQGARGPIAASGDLLQQQRRCYRDGYVDAVKADAGGAAEESSECSEGPLELTKYKDLDEEEEHFSHSQKDLLEESQQDSDSPR